MVRWSFNAVKNAEGDEIDGTEDSVEKVWTETPTVDRSPSRNNTCFATIEGNAYFQNTTLIVIVINAIWIMVDTEWNHVRLKDEKTGKLPLEPASTVIEHLFCGYFTFEVIVRFFAYKRKRYCWKDAWFVFDGTLVIFMVLETWIFLAISGDVDLSQFSSFRLLRLLRLTRMAKVMKFFPALMVIVKGMLNAISAVFWIIVFLILAMYVFSIIFLTQIASPKVNQGFICEFEGNDTHAKEPADCLPGLSMESAQVKFQSLFASMMTLFTHGVLGDNLAQIMKAIKCQPSGCGCDDCTYQGSLALMWLFVIFMIIAALTLLNMLIGVLCQVIDDTSKEEFEEFQKNELQECLENAFNLIDTSKDGMISKKEWAEIKKNDQVRKVLMSLGVEDDEQLDQRLDQMQETLFEQPLNEEGEVDISSPGNQLDFDEFISRVVEIRWDTPASAIDVEMMKNRMQSNAIHLRKMLCNIEERLGIFVENNSEGEAAAADDGGEADVGEGSKAKREFLKSVPTELLLHVLKMRGAPGYGR